MGGERPRAPPAALMAELAASASPRRPARGLRRSLESNRLSRRDVSAPPSPPRGLPLRCANARPPTHSRLVLSSPVLPPPTVPSGSRSPPLPSPARAAVVCCHCDVTKGRPRGTFPSSVMSNVRAGGSRRCLEWERRGRGVGGRRGCEGCVRPRPSAVRCPKTHQVSVGETCNPHRMPLNLFKILVGSREEAPSKRSNISLIISR